MTTHVCEICGEEFILGEGGEIFDGKHLCMRCLNRETTVCEHCGGRVWNDNAVHGSFCANCFDEYYTTCTGCGAVISREYAYYLERDEEYHDNPYCRRCYESFNETIHDYYFKPDPIFYGTGKLFMGVEIELDEGGEDDDNAKKAGLGRYTAVNLMNDNTVEFRIFRGTLRYTTFMATLEFVDCLCQMAMKFNDEVFQKMSWSDFVSDIDTEKYPELVDYLKSRRLYVNEPVQETEEI